MVYDGCIYYVGLYVVVLCVYCFDWLWWEWFVNVYGFGVF